MITLLDRQMPEPSFIERDPAKVTREMIGSYEALAGKTLYPAQAERLLIDVAAYRETLIREAVQDAAKLNLVRFSRGVILDYLGENVGVLRLAAVAARVTLRFSFDPAPTVDTVLPAESQASSGGVAFATTHAVTVLAGATEIDAPAVCTQTGEVGNGFAPGQIKTLVDAPEGLAVSAVANLTTSEGGAEVESDEHFRVRIVLAPESFSVAGSEEAYRFHAMSAHPEIVDVAVISHAPGEVTLYPLTAAGLPGEAIKAMVAAKCSGEKVRPLNDHVLIADPVPADYAIDARIVLAANADAALAKTEADKAALTFRNARQQFGQSIVRSQLIDALHVYGIHKVTLDSPAADLDLLAWEYPRCSGISIQVSGIR
jgi:phage-related baseplate assembly protein